MARWRKLLGDLPHSLGTRFSCPYRPIIDGIVPISGGGRTFVSNKFKKSGQGHGRRHAMVISVATVIDEAVSERPALRMPRK